MRAKHIKWSAVSSRNERIEIALIQWISILGSRFVGPAAHASRPLTWQTTYSFGWLDIALSEAIQDAASDNSGCIPARSSGSSWPTRSVALRQPPPYPSAHVRQ